MNKHSALTAVIALACTATLTVAGCGGGEGGGAVSVSKYCKDAQAFSERFAGLNEFDIQESDLPELKKASAGLSSLAGEAPTQIRADMKTEADVLDKVVSGKGDSVDDHAAQAASDRVDAYESDHCANGD
jgi:hypothetical protein